jgi:hypothetical protein
MLFVIVATAEASYLQLDKNTTRDMTHSVIAAIAEALYLQHRNFTGSIIYRRVTVAVVKAATYNFAVQW